jgi:hypothetical protein
VIVDAHTQFGPGLSTGSPLRPPLKAVTADELVPNLDRAKIDKAIVFAPDWLGSTDEDFVDPNYEEANAAIASGSAKYQDRLIPFARVNPKFGSRATTEFERCLTGYGFRGLYLSNVAEGFSYRDVRLLGPLFEICSSRGVPAMVYTWLAPSQPLHLLDLAKAFPKVNIILAHSGKEMLGDPLAIAEYTDNIYFETSFTGARTTPTIVKRFGVERVIFGSNIPYGLPEVEIQRIRRWGQLTGAQLDQVLGGNVARLVGLTA